MYSSLDMEILLCNKLIKFEMKYPLYAFKWIRSGNWSDADAQYSERDQKVRLKRFSNLQS